MEALAAGVRAGNRLALAKALTLIESTKPAHQTAAMELLHLLHGRGAAPPTAPPRVDAFRIGVSGPPGAGKSSLIETLGCALVDAGERVAVLAVDPSSDSSGGAILGDKTRMARLSSLDAAFVRPSPTRGALGGVTRTTAEALSVCAAAGYSRLLVETVGVGQSEIAVADLVDCMLLVLPPVGGDELQAIKRGITEVADVVAVNKADGSMKMRAARAVASFRATLHLHPARKRSWTPVVLPVSAHSGEGVAALLGALDEYWEAMRASGELKEVRARQRARVAWTAAEERLLGRLRADPGVKQLYRNLLPDIAAGTLGPRAAAAALVERFDGGSGGEEPGGVRGADGAGSAA